MLSYLRTLSRERHLLILVACVSALSLSGCDWGSSSTTASTPTYTVGGTITGLAAGQSVTLLDIGGDGYVATGNGAFTFATPLAAGVAYAVTVGTQPSNGTTQTQKCTVTNGSGTMGSANISTVSVSCLNLGYTSLYSFAGGSDGQHPQGGLIQDASGNLYGATVYGGSNNLGTVFKIDPAASPVAESVLHSFGGGSDGYYPYAGLAMDTGGNLYGTTHGGGANSAGTVFKIDSSTSPATETVLHSFNGSDGQKPWGGLILDASGNLYGTTDSGGANSAGTVFKIDPSGNENWLYSFLGGTSDGQNPEADLIQDGSGNLYGTTWQGGGNGDGTVFKIDPSGNETVLYSFNGSDGSFPAGGLILDTSGNLYGTTYNGGANSPGTVFKIDPSTSPVTETVLYSFGSGSDGQAPYGGLVQDTSGNLYGTTYNGGANNVGTVFRYVLP